MVDITVIAMLGGAGFIFLLMLRALMNVSKGAGMVHKDVSLGMTEMHMDEKEEKLEEHEEKDMEKKAKLMAQEERADKVERQVENSVQREIAEVANVEARAAQGQIPVQVADQAALRVLNHVEQEVKEDMQVVKQKENDLKAEENITKDEIKNEKAEEHIEKQVEKIEVVEMQTEKAEERKPELRRSAAILAEMMGDEEKVEKAKETVDKQKEKVEQNELKIIYKNRDILDKENKLDKETLAEVEKLKTEIKETDPNKIWGPGGIMEKKLQIAMVLEKVAREEELLEQQERYARKSREHEEEVAVLEEITEDELTLRKEADEQRKARLEAFEAEKERDKADLDKEMVKFRKEHTDSEEIRRMEVRIKIAKDLIEGDLGD